VNMRSIIMASLALVSSGGALWAQSYRSFIVFLPAVSHPWSVKLTDPYAMWDANSKNSAGTEVEVSSKNAVIDTAPLVPEAVYSSDQPIVEGAKVWLPKGGLLLKMNGGTGDWYCTWRFDDRSALTQDNFAAENLSGFGEYNLCLQGNADSKIGNPKIMIADFKALMTITDQDSGMGRYRNGVGVVSPVSVTPVNPQSFPTRTQLQVRGEWKSAKGGSVCLHVAISNMASTELISSGEKCFNAVGQSVELGGGAYALLSIGDQKKFKVRIDKPIKIQGLGPRLIK